MEGLDGGGVVEQKLVLGCCMWGAVVAGKCSVVESGGSTTAIVGVLHIKHPIGMFFFFQHLPVIGIWNQNWNQ